MKKIDVSIITPSFNQGQFIERTIQSVLRQSYRNIQYIIVDRGSTDRTMDIVYRYKDKINILIREADKGQADAINKGFNLATGQLVGWLNSDDVLYPAAVAKVVHAYQEQRKAVIMPRSLDWIDARGHFIKNAKIGAGSLEELLNLDYRIAQQGSFFDMTTLRKTGFCNTDLHYCMGLDLVLRLAKEGGIHFINGPLGSFRIWEKSNPQTGNAPFLKEIYDTILLHGARKYAPSIVKIRYYIWKERMKKYAELLLQDLQTLCSK